MFSTQTEISFSEVVASALPAKYPVAKAKRDAIKAGGGAQYEALLAKERQARALFRARRVGRMAELRREWVKKHGKRKSFKAHLCARARSRGRKRGLEATITPTDLVWPTHCPVLGLRLDYPDRPGSRGDQSIKPNWPSLDRWDNTKGYVPGNVFVISYRANTLKNSATYEEILRIAKYLAKRPP